MKSIIFVLTNSEDGKHTETVISKLEKLEQPVFRFDSDRIARGELKINFEANQEKFGYEIDCFDKKISIKNVKSIWYRRPNHLSVKIEDLVQRKYAEDEINIFLKNLWAITGNVFWLNNPNNLDKARNKLLQLNLAREMEFNVPQTIITNDPAKVRDFFERCKKKMIFKAIYHEFLDYGKKSFNIPTTLITENHLSQSELIKNMPSLFQEFIDKEYELRVTVVGDKIFPIKIDSQNNPLTIVDWRHPECISKLSYSIVEIPNKISEFCLTILKKLGLVFGAFDFIMGKDGKIYFLEVNPNGQWYWLEDLTGAPISNAIAELLIKANSK